MKNNDARRAKSQYVDEHVMGIYWILAASAHDWQGGVRSFTLDIQTGAHRDKIRGANQ